MRIVLSTAPPEIAEALARALVEERLAACVNVVPGVLSVFRWEGEVQSAGEVLLVAKTTEEREPALRERLARLHPYDVPEVVALETSTVNDAYANWVRDATSA